MPPILDRLVSQLKAKGYSKQASFAIATKSLQKAGDLKPGSTQATAKGTKRGSMSPSQRAKLRAAKYSHSSPNNFSYNSKTNRTKRK